MRLREPTYLPLPRGLRSPWFSGIVSVLGIALLCGCRDPEPQASPEIAIAPSALATLAKESTTAASAPALTPEQAFERANSLIAKVMAQADLGGAPGLEKQRASMVARAKSEPVVFVRTPEATEVAAGVQSLRTTFESTDYPWRELKDLRNRFSKRPEVMRELLLREGYLYTEEPNRAFTLVSQIKPKHLFDEERLWVHRGPWLMHAERGEEGDYFFLDGPEQGKKVRLLHLDRVGTGDVPEPLHRDLRGLRYRIHFERAKLRHHDERNIVADLRYGTFWVPTLLESNGARLDVVAEAIPPQDADAIRETRKLLERKARAVSVLRHAMREQIDEGLPFDEPKTEDGQQDGALRRQWRGAYLANRDYFRFNEDRYPVFDDEGKPRVPQVCVDFMVDTFERASGTWWRGKDAPIRERTIGKLNLVEFAENDQLRRTKGFLAFAREHEEWFDVLTFPKYMRVELGYKPTFFAWLEKKADHFEPGDIVFIRGMTPWDEVDEHSHSFFIFESDPVSGVPIAIAGNAGPANLWSWETEARRTPNRSVRDRIRPKIEWLETFITADPSLELEPPALVSGKK
jgi:hypothetical protein